MTDTPAPLARASWHLWVVGLVAILWNGFGCVDFIMTMTDRDAWFAQMGITDAQLAYFNAMPQWTFVAWAVGVFGGALGGLLLLLRSRLAVPAFVASFLGWLAGAVYAFGLSNGLQAMGDMWPMQVVIGAACLFFIWYASSQKKRGVLR